MTPCPFSLAPFEPVCYSPIDFWGKLKIVFNPFFGEMARFIENEASKIPEQLAARLLNGPFGVVELRKLKDQLGEIINLLTK